MNLFLNNSHRNKLVWAAVAAVALAGALYPLAIKAADAPATAPTTRAAVLPQPSVVETAPDPVIATIDGIPVEREKFDSLLMATGGPRLFEQIMPLVIAQEACDKAGIEVKPADVDAEKARIIKNVADQYPDLKQADRDRILNVGLQRQGITNQMEFVFFLQRAACARALAKGKAAPTEQQVQDAWTADNADKVAVLDIVVPTPAASSELREYVKSLTKTQDENAQAVQAFAQSKNYRMGQTVFSAGLPITDKSLDTLKTFAMPLQTGELSAMTPISEGDGKPTDIHVMYCLKRVPATKKVMSTTDHDALRDKLTDAMESQWAEEHMRKLMAEARVDIKDKTLSTYYAELNKQAQAQRDAAASQAATAPATVTTAPGK